MRLALVTLALGALLGSGCAASRSGVEAQVDTKWHTWSWTDWNGTLSHCEKSKRVIGNYACIYQDNAGREGFACFIEEYTPDDHLEVNGAYPPSDHTWDGYDVRT